MKEFIHWSFFLSKQSWKMICLQNPELGKGKFPATYLYVCWEQESRGISTFLQCPGTKMGLCMGRWPLVVIYRYYKPIYSMNWESVLAFLWWSIYTFWNYFIKPFLSSFVGFVSTNRWVHMHFPLRLLELLGVWSSTWQSSCGGVHFEMYRRSELIG